MRTTLYYAGSDLLVKAGGFLLLPLITLYLSPADYGLLNLATVTATIVAGVVTLGLRGGLLKQFFHLEPDVRSSMVGGLAVFLIVWPLAAWCLLSAAGVMSALLGVVSFRLFGIFSLAGLVAALSYGLLYLPVDFTRFAGRPKAYASINVSQFVIYALAVAALLVIWKAGVVGVLGAQLAGVAIAGAIGHRAMKGSIHYGWRPSAVRDVLGYSLPLMPHFLGHMLMSSVDRYVLVRYSGVSTVGQYAVVAQVGMGLNMLAGAMNNVLIGVFLSKPDGEVLRRVVHRYTEAILLAGAVTLSLAPTLIKLLLPQDYHESTALLPLILTAAVFYGLYLIPMGVLSIQYQTSGPVPVATVSGAMVSLGLNLLLVPRYGMLGAALASLGAYVTLFGVMATNAIGRGGRLYLSWRLAWPLIPLGVLELAITLLRQSGWHELLLKAGGWTLVGVVFAKRYVDSARDSSE